MLSLLLFLRLFSGYLYIIGKLFSFLTKFCFQDFFIFVNILLPKLFNNFFLAPGKLVCTQKI